MTHRHVLGQGFNIQHMMEYVYCIHCDKKWSKEEVTRIINATEALSAKRARRIAFPGVRGKGEISPLMDYARTLEGEDD